MKSRPMTEDQLTPNSHKHFRKVDQRTLSAKALLTFSMTGKLIRLKADEATITEALARDGFDESDIPTLILFSVQADELRLKSNTSAQAQEAIAAAAKVLA